MVGNIIEPINVGGSSGPVDPDDYFDPVTHIATEENFIKFLECEVYDSKYIGYGVQLSNSVEYNDGVWIIADVDHDSANTGQTNCYDLISKDCFHSTTFGSNQDWRSSNPRTWLNNTFYPGFGTNFKSHMINIKYKSLSTWYTDDKIILPSYVELNGTTGSAYYEGITYPIFTDNTSRKKYKTGTTTYGDWWTRSQDPSYNLDVWYVSSDGNMYSVEYDIFADVVYLAPILRVS